MMSLRCAPSLGCAPARGVAAPQWGGRITTFGATEIFGSCAATPVASGRGKKVGPPETRMLKQYPPSEFVRDTQLVWWFWPEFLDVWNQIYHLISVPATGDSVRSC